MILHEDGNTIPLYQFVNQSLIYRRNYSHARSASERLSMIQTAGPLTPLMFKSIMADGPPDYVDEEIDLFKYRELIILLAVLLGCALGLGLAALIRN